MLGARRFAFLGLWGALGVASAFQGCAKGEVEFEDAANTVSTTTQGGSGGIPGSGGQGGTPGLCAQNCESISTPPCLKSVCNDGTYQGVVGDCVVVPDEGASCDDGMFCTIDDTCNAMGVCTGGPPNDCGMAAPPCNEIVCDENADSCDEMPAMNGAACQDPTNLCIKGSTCSNGLCIGGAPDDCFFFPVPDDCHVAVCNPMTGMCESTIGNEGLGCTDPNDLCTVSKTCMNGICQGGTAKDCSYLSQGCNVGVCDTTSGMCTTMGVMNGQPCNDLNACTTGELCNNGNCTGGSPVTTCTNGDGCCPSGCNQNNDSDCGCSTNHALAATPSSSGGGQNSTGYGPANFNNGVTGAQCLTSGCSMCFGWITNGTTPGGAWAQYDWPSTVTIGSIWVDANTCTGQCYSGGRTINSGEVQWWNGSSWITATTFTNQNTDIALNFNPPLVTTKLRLYNLTAGSCGQASNSLIYEWYVYPGVNCSPPP